MDFGSSKQEEGYSILMQPLVDLEGRWVPPREPAAQPDEGSWMPGTPTKRWLPPMDMEYYPWKGHSSSSLILQQLELESWDTPPGRRMLSFTELLGLADNVVESKQSSGSSTTNHGVVVDASDIAFKDNETTMNGKATTMLLNDGGKGISKKKTTGMRLVPKPKKKKVRPKVIRDAGDKKKKEKKKMAPKPPPTPKPMISKRMKQQGKKKLGPEEQLPSCKRGFINLDLGMHNLVQTDDDRVNNKTAAHGYQLRPPNKLSKWGFDHYLALDFLFDEKEVITKGVDDDEIRYLTNGGAVDDKGRCRPPAEEDHDEYYCLGFPTMYNKKRSQRRRRYWRWRWRAAREAFPLSILIRRIRLMIGKKRSCRSFTARRNLASLIALPICEELPWKLGQRQQKMVIPNHSCLKTKRKGKKRQIKNKPLQKQIEGRKEEEGSIELSLIQKLETPISTSSCSGHDRMDNKMPLQIEGRKEEEGRIELSLIQKLETPICISSSSSIDHDHDQTENKQLVPAAAKNNQLVPYKAKKFMAKVDLDPETMRMWDQLVLLQSRNASVEEEMNREEDGKRWEDERLVFRERVKAFLACMHVLQGDRRFQPWKGSVLDSIVGVFLTQNVSDKLSSSAFMNLAALFPLDSTSNGGECWFVEEAEEEESEEMVDELNCGDEIGPATEEEMSSELESSNNEMMGESSENHETKINSNNCQERMNKGGDGNIINNGDGGGKEEESWDSLRRMYSRRRGPGAGKDSVDWEGVRGASVHHLSNAISTRGMNNVLAARIKDFLDRLVRDHHRLDLEWLRDVPPQEAKKYLLSIKGLGLKSTECVRLLTLHHHAFPVDTNVARITVRLGWVPLQPLPSDFYLHNLELYPPMDTIQKYLWPRLCTLDQNTLYELHYQMITFGKVFCTKRNPYCQACPLRAECKHYLSSIARRLPLLKNGEDEQPHPPVPKFPRQAAANLQVVLMDDNPVLPTSISIVSVDDEEGKIDQDDDDTNCVPIIEMPASPEPKCRRPAEMDPEIRDMEDFCDEDYEEIPTILLPRDDDHQGYLRYGGAAYDDEQQKCSSPSSIYHHQDNFPPSQALVGVFPPTPARKLKYISRLRTEHYVYELPDSHRLLIERGMKREACDPCPFLLAIWSPGETADSFEAPGRRCNPEGGSGELCKDETCSFCNATREQDSHTIRGTLLIPCRTAMRGSFPLNGTYFQVNEVFADDESSHNPIIVNRGEIWDLTRRMTYFGTSTTSIFRGLSLGEIHQCFWRGFICVRGFDRKSRAPKPLARRLHITPSHVGKAKAEDDED